VSDNEKNDVPVVVIHDFHVRLFIVADPLVRRNISATSGVGSSSPAAYAKEIRLSIAQDQASLESSIL
jgi:hypothetical protein